MTPFPTPRSSGSVTTRGAGALAKRLPGEIGYVTVEQVGFERFPEAVRRVIARALVGVEIAANAEAPVTKRRADGSYYQVISGWWASTARLVMIEARRPLGRRGTSQFAPSGVWSVATTIHRFAPGVVAERSCWRLDAKTTARSGAEAPRAIDPLDVLPTALVAPVRGGRSAAWQRFGRKWARETIVAIRIDAGRVRVLKAERAAGYAWALKEVDWQATSLDAAIAETRALRDGVLRLPRRARSRNHDHCALLRRD